MEGRGWVGWWAGGMEAGGMEAGGMEAGGKEGELISIKVISKFYENCRYDSDHQQ